jgi:hypothetical protein
LVRIFNWIFGLIKFFVRDRRMHPHTLWHMNPQSHPVTHCSFDKQTLICALTPYCKRPDMVIYKILIIYSSDSFFIYRSNIKLILIYYQVIYMFVILIRMFPLNLMMIWRFVHHLMMHHKHPIDELVCIHHTI